MQEAVRVITGLAALVGFGLMMGLHPALYGATADMLAREVKIAHRLPWMMAGLAAGATLLVLIFQSFDPTNLVALLEHRVDEALLNRVVDLVAGSVFIIGAVIVALWRLRVPELPHHPPKAPPESAQPLGYFVIGFSSAVIGFTTLPVMYLTGRVAVGLAEDLAGRLLAYGVFLIALCGPFFAIAWIWSRFPALSRRVSALYAIVLRLDYRPAFAVLLAFSGTVLIAFALLRPTFAFLPTL